MAQSVIVLTGEIDVYTAEATCRVLDTIDGPAVIDLSGVRFLSSSGLTELARLAKRVGNGTITLSNMQPQVLRVLQIVRFDMLFLFDPAPSKSD